MNLVCRDRRSLEQGESNMAEDALLRLARREIFSRHKTEVSRWSAEGKSVAFVVCPHAGKSGATRDLSLEVEDVGHFHIGFGRLIVIAILVQPWNGKRTGAAVKRAGRNWRAAIFTGVECRSEYGYGGEACRQRAQPKKMPPANFNGERYILFFHGNLHKSELLGRSAEMALRV